MSSTLISVLYSGTLSGSVVSKYTSPSLTTSVIKSASISNNTSGVVSLVVHKVPSGGSADDTNIVIPARNIASKESYQAYELLNKVLAAGDSLQASGNGLTLVIDGIKVVQ